MFQTESDQKTVRWTVFRESADETCNIFACCIVKTDIKGLVNPLLTRITKSYLNKAESWKKHTDFWQGKHEKAIANAVESVFKFNEGVRTGYDDVLYEIRVKGDILPDLSSNHPRDRMSPRAVLAHEFHGY